MFDEAVKGVDAVAHLASPFYILDVKDPQDLIQPAIKGTTGLLKSIQKNKSVRRRKAFPPRCHFLGEGNTRLLSGETNVYI